MRKFVRNSIKGGRCNAFSQKYESEISDEVFKSISNDLDSIGNIFDLLETYFEFLSRNEKLYAKAFDSKYEDYRDIRQKEKTDYINNKLNKLPIQEQLSKLDLINSQMDFDAASLYHSATYDENSVYPKIETAYTFKPPMNDVFVNDIIIQIFYQDGNDSAILKLKFYNPPKTIFQHLPTKEKNKNIGVNGSKNGYIIDTITSVDVCEIFKMGGKVNRIFKGGFYREKFKISYLEMSWKNIFTLEKKYKNENIDLMQNLVLLFMNS